MSNNKIRICTLTDRSQRKITLNWYIFLFLVDSDQDNNTLVPMTYSIPVKKIFKLFKCRYEILISL